uniref:7TM_GPCR_Srx domain-containing protein n=1 Tax=Angiostrongylus cantonensis TaxID=6313 RepID=A0A0K0D399_ANGCA
MISFLSIAAWTAGVISYAILGLNRCIAICYYGTKAKAFNQVSVAIVLSLCTWIIGAVAALLGTIPEPIVGVRRDMWTVSFVTTEGKRPGLFIACICIIDCIGVGIQWICSIMVLLRIREVKQRIYKNKLNQNSANRFHKQVFSESILSEKLKQYR